MTYYEELGVPPDASAEEIRRAYKTVARLLHPDRQHEESLRLAADRQLKRLNFVVAVLSNPEHRSRYDAELARSQQSPPRGLIGSVRGLSERICVGSRLTEWLSWAAATAIAMGALWWVLPGSAGDSGHAADTGGAQVANSGPAPVRTISNAAAAEPRTALRYKRGGREAREQLSAKKAVGMPTEGSYPTIEAPPVFSPELPSVSRTYPPNLLRDLPKPVQSPPQPPEPPVPVSDPFGGRWVFSNQYYEPKPGFYPPEYVEAVIERNGAELRGSYKAAYRVTSPALSPTVQFTFNGRADVRIPELAWSGPHGAKGQIRLKPLTRDSIEISWWATELPQAHLASGTAVLIRLRQD